MTSEYVYSYDVEALIGDTQPNHRGQYKIVCPECKKEKELEGNYNYSKRKLYSSDPKLVAHCMRCNRTYITSNEISSTINNKINMRINLSPEFSITPISYDRVAKLNEDSINYLLGRSKYYELDKMIDSGFLPVKNKVIINFKLNGSSYFYQIRYMNPSEDSSKYYTPECEWKPLYIAGGVFNGANPTVIVEGVFSAHGLHLALGSDFNVIATLGSSISSEQLSMLNYLGVANKIGIFMDTCDISSYIHRSIRSKYPYSSIIPSISGYDPEECLEYFESLDDYKRYIVRSMYNPVLTV